MATVNRSLILNPVEPAMFSFRAASGLQTSIRVNLFDVNGAVLRQDLGLQMQLTSRSKGTIQTYSMPATDVANGKAQATIPADDLTDPNGYNVHLYGTRNNSAELLGRGVLRLTGGPGISQAPSDIIDNVPIVIAYGLDAVLTVSLWQDAYKSIPFDLASATISAAIYPGAGNPTALAVFAVTATGTPGQLLLTLPAAAVAPLDSPCWWALRASSGGGLITLCQGTVTITGTKP